MSTRFRVTKKAMRNILLSLLGDVNNLKNELMLLINILTGSICWKIYWTYYQ